jgi:hypothetical protein
MRVERVVDTGLEYVPGERVVVRVVQRDRRTRVTDDGAAVERAGRPAGWRDVARTIEDDLIVNVGRSGQVFLPCVPKGPAADEVVRRIGEASLALYQDLLELA